MVHGSDATYVPEAVKKFIPDLCQAFRPGRGLPRRDGSQFVAWWRGKLQFFGGVQGTHGGIYT